MTIVLNEAAKPKAREKWDFKDSKLLQALAKQQRLVGMDKANLIFNLGIAYANAENEVAAARILRVSNLDMALTWDDTPQGFNFWCEAHNNLMEK
jgi:uncharacterized NAD(P)/FAD-binding protein YdhS